MAPLKLGHRVGRADKAGARVLAASTDLLRPRRFNRGINEALKELLCDLLALDLGETEGLLKELSGSVTHTRSVTLTGTPVSAPG